MESIGTGSGTGGMSFSSITCKLSTCAEMLYKLFSLYDTFVSYGNFWNVFHGLQV